MLFFFLPILNIRLPLSALFSQMPALQLSARNMFPVHAEIRPEAKKGKKKECVQIVVYYPFPQKVVQRIILMLVFYLIQRGERHAVILSVYGCT